MISDKNHQAFLQIWKNSILPDKPYFWLSTQFVWIKTPSELTQLWFLKRLKTVIYALIWCVMSVSWGCITIVLNGACERCRLASHRGFPAAENAGAATPQG